MQTTEDAQQQWQDLAFESFFNMVKASDGDFDAIAQLSNALNDDVGIKFSTERAIAISYASTL
jgi:ubiquinone biosynthesis protein Coq4